MDPGSIDDTISRSNRLLIRRCDTPAKINELLQVLRQELTETIRLQEEMENRSHSSWCCGRRRFSFALIQRDSELRTMIAVLKEKLKQLEEKKEKED